MIGPTPSAGADAQGCLALVLHAHLPFVRHPEHDVFLEENWLYEAITETYLDQVHQVVDIAQRHGTVAEGDALLQFLEGIDDPAWLEIEQHPPAELLNILGI